MTQTTQLRHPPVSRNTIGDALRRSVARAPQKEALIFGARRWTYGQLDAAANRVAAALLEAGLRPGDRVGAFGRNSDAYVLLWLACVRGGLVHVPINYALGEEEFEYIVSQSKAAALFFDPSLAALVDKVRPRLDLRVSGSFFDGTGLDVLTAALRQTEAPEPAVPVDDDDLAQFLYTSGTTAAPKGAMMTHRALLAEYMSCLVELDHKSDDVQLAALPLYHSAQMHVFLMPALLVGATIVLIQAPAADECLRLIGEQKITSFFAPPTVWISLLRHPAFDHSDLSSLAKAYYGASIMPVPVLQELRHRLPKVGVYNCYGQSEISPLATVLRPEEHEARPASAGRPVLNVETRVVDHAMNDMPPGQQGEIVHRSPQLLVGYWDKSEQTDEAFAGGWFHSGDVGYFDEGGYLYIVDRIKDIINTGGVVVSSREVEEALFSHPAVSEVAVVALPDAKWIEAVAAVVVLKVGQQATAEELIEHARRHLAPFKLPKKVVFVESLPRNTAGKILKRQLRQEFPEGAS